jgi:membrane protease YdiL (CAAX protease family)
MKKINLYIKEWIKKYPIEGFFLLAIAICFGTLFPAIYIVPHDTTLGQILAFYLGRIGAYSPVLAGILITQIIQSELHKFYIRQRIKILLPTWFIAIVIQVAELNLTAPHEIPMIGLIILALPISLLPAWVISSAFSRTDGVRNWLETLVKPKGNIVYYLIAFLTFPFIHVFGNAITNFINSRTLFPDISQVISLVYTIFITFLSVLFFSGGINEEAGWRGFAQKRLQEKYSPIVSIFVLWFLMVIWHIPNDLMQYQNGGYLMVRVAIYPVITILFSWIYNRTNGSILPVAIFHASMNSMNPLMGIFPITTAGNIMLIGLAIIVLVSDRMWQKLPKNHPAVYQ